MIFAKNCSVLFRPALAAILIVAIGCTKSAPELKNHVVVKVNDEDLAAENFSALLAARLKVFNVLSAKDSAVIAQAKNAVVQEFIVSVVTRDWAEANQLFVRKEQIDEEIIKMQKNYPDSIAFRKALADEGLSYSLWESRVKHSILERIVVEKLRSAIADPTVDELKSYYAKNKSLYQQAAAIKVRQVVLDTKAGAERVKKELAAGKSLAALAKNFSITAEATAGGLTDWIEKGTAAVFDAAFKMSVGQRSQIVKSPYGWHVIELVEKRQAKSYSFEDVRAKIKKALLSEKEQMVYSAWLEEQVLKARVFKDDEFLAQITVKTRSTR